MGLGAPVVFGQDIGRSRNVRAARNANASASIESPRQPTCSALINSHGTNSFNIDIKVGLWRPPPHAIRRFGITGIWSKLLATAFAVNAVKVAAPSSSDNPRTMLALKS